MESIAPIGSTADPKMLTPTMSTGQASSSVSLTDKTASTSVTTQTTTLQSSFTHVSQASSCVEAFLNVLSSGSQDNELLRMIIELLVLELLLGKNGEAGQSRGKGADALTSLSNSSRSSYMLTAQYSTSASQAEYHTTEMTAAKAVLSSASTQPDGNPGGQIDLTA